MIRRLLKADLTFTRPEGSLEGILEAHPLPARTPDSPSLQGVSAGKNTYTYDAHTYHTKVPPQGIVSLLSHYLPDGGLVLDPFAGSGMTGVAARSHGCDAILNELSPAAAFIADRFTTAFDAEEFEGAVSALLESLSPLRQALYTTTCRECGKDTELLYTVWSYEVDCPGCGDTFLLWDACRKYGRTVREHQILKEFPCPGCQRTLKKSRLARGQARPALTGYRCCGSRQQERTHPPDQRDLELIRRIEDDPPLAEGFYPSMALPDGVNLRQPKKHGLTSFDRFYTARNLAALSHLWQGLHRFPSPDASGFLAFVFTSLYQRVTRLSEFRFWGGSGNTARFNVPFIYNESNVFVTFERKARTIQDHLLSTAARYSGRVAVRCGSATSLDTIPDSSVDLIFTDPPFGANINYSEMNLLWESWLGVYTDNTSEAIMNSFQSKGLDEYRSLMTASLQECHRVLRPGHWMLLVFMNSSGKVWQALQQAVVDAGFDVVKADIFDKQHGTFKQFVSENTAGCDLVLHCRKPRASQATAQEASRHADGRAPDVAASIRRLVEELGDRIPSTTYLHVDRTDEVDYRQLYSQWLAESLGLLPPVDFQMFRDIVQGVLADQPPKGA